MWDANAKGDELKIKMFFRVRRRKAYTPEEVIELIYPNTIAITANGKKISTKLLSVRRAMNNLANPLKDNCCLIRTEIKRKGWSDKPVGAYMML